MKGKPCQLDSTNVAAAGFLGVGLSTIFEAILSH